MAKKESGERETFTTVVTDINPDTGECYKDTPENREAGHVREEQRPIVKYPYVKSK